MFRIRRVFDNVLPVDRAAIAKVQAMLRLRFPGVSEQEVAALPDKLSNPMKQGFQYLLYIADDLQGRLEGFALVSREPSLRFWYLDYMATGKRLSGRGVGGALYDRVRDEARMDGAFAIFFECAPDDPAEVEDVETYRRNCARLRFYERYGVRPVVGTEYEKPVTPGSRGSPYLMYDDLGSGQPLARELARAASKAILERKYRRLCPPDYVRSVVESFHDDPVRLREFRYVRRPQPFASPLPPPRFRGQIALVVNDRHAIHHVRDRGYVESPVRISAILKEIEPTGLFRTLEPRRYAERCIRSAHDPALVGYLDRVCRKLPLNASVYPYVFPVRNAARPPNDVAVQAGYYCIDTFTPLTANAYLAARRAVDCALTAADAILHGFRMAYALVRPPGHHAERRNFGGFCYFNNAAIAAQHLVREARVAVLDVDYHHGNGQQDIFYERRDVLTVSIHGHPRFAYPYFSGWEEERGRGDGEGYNINYPLPEKVDGERYRQALERALSRIKSFRPGFLIVALGLDTARHDPTGSWSLAGADFRANGRLIGRLKLPTLVVQEGGYRTRTLGANARHFFEGLAESALAV